MATRVRRHSISSPLELDVAKRTDAQQIDAQVEVSLISRKRQANDSSSELNHVSKRPALVDRNNPTEEKPVESEELPVGEFACSQSSHCY